MKKIVVIEPGYRDYEEEKQGLAEFDPVFEIVKLGSTKEQVLAAVKDADAIMVREAVVDKDVIDAAEKCKAVVRYGVGVDNIDLAYAKSKNIKVANVPDYGSEDVAEHALALLMGATRRIVTRDEDVRNGKWGIGQDEPIPRIFGKNLGVLGFGRIAKCFITKAKGLGFKNIFVLDPVLTEEIAKENGIIKADLDTICRESDFISVHVPLLPSTRHMIDASKIALMKKMAVIVNAGRGGIIDERALAQALKEHRIFAAGIDTFEKEPVDTENELLKLKNTVVSDHNAWYTQESVIELQSKGAREVLRVLKGEDPLHWVNK